MNVTLNRTGVHAVALGAALLLAPNAGIGAQQDDREFRWNGAVASGQWVTVRNLNGEIRVGRSAGNEVEIVARKRTRDGDLSAVRMEVKKASNGGLLVCALWEGGVCEEGEYRGRRSGDGWWGRDDRRNNVSVEITVRVPQGIKLDVATTNGELEIDGATAEVRARTVNGGIDARSLGGPVTARTTNGGISVRMGDAGSQDLSYHTTNGSIEIELPASFDADVEMRTTNGAIETDFPMTVQGRFSPRRLEARIGNGGRRLEARTTNGSITLRKRA
ncbi:MAG TPA: DUF4097 family beta strand repeat-containing protein [Gemmatimonadaceae bacterium]|nr:DUF4097 family beta strand repeat-containing protein [Gemmatimonadaceae bacterium]